ncbi:MAG: two-component system LytT family response regulator [Halieaceae bacterium]|jgi:two-component system LytT family response regulator
MNPLRVILVDDEPLARRGLKLRLQEIPEVELIAECSNGYEALSAVAEHSPDLLFLDIQMPTLSGFDVVRQLQSDNMPLVVFVTAFDQYALDAFEIHAVDYVLKPIEVDRLRIAVNRAIEHKAKLGVVDQKARLLDLVSNLTGETIAEVDRMVSDGADVGLDRWPDKISIKDGGEIHIVPTADIDWVDAAGDYMCVHANGHTHIMRTTMKQLEAMLNPKLFKRIHRSTIVNTDRVEKLQSLLNGEFILSLNCGARLKMSRSYKATAKEMM